MALVAAGNSLISSGGSGYASRQQVQRTNPTPISTLGVRSLRDEYLKPWHRNELARNLKLIEERVAKDPPEEPVGSEERETMPRFRHLFQGGGLLPPTVFLSALELPSAETVNGKQLSYDQDVLVLRDNLVMTYKPLQSKIRMLVLREIEELPLRMVTIFTRAWTLFETAWLRNKDGHAVEALQPLVKAILSLEPLLLSVEKERLLPWPRGKHQKVVTLRCLEGFVQTLCELSASVLPSIGRELDHDPRLLLLMDHVLSLKGERPISSFLEGISLTPEVAFPTQDGATGLRSLQGGQAGKGITLDAYAFKLLGASVGDAAASGRVSLASLAKSTGIQLLAPSASLPSPVKDSELHDKAYHHAVELLSSFEAVKDALLALKPSLEYIDASLDKDDVFVAHLRRFERAFLRAKKLFLEPGNLA